MAIKVELEKGEVDIICSALRTCGYKWADMKDKKISAKGHWALALENWFNAQLRKK